MTDVAHSLQRIRRRLLAAQMLVVSVRSLLAGSLAALALMALRLWSGEAPWSPWLVLAVLAAALGAGLLWTVSRRPSLERTALVIDRLGDTRDRFTTALALPRGETGPLPALAAAECGRFVSRFEAAPLIPLRIPRRALALIVPVAAAALLCWHYDLSQRVDPATLAAQREITQKADELETLTRQIEQTAKELESPELDRLAEAMREALERLRDAAKEKEASARDALRELSALEAMLEAMQQEQRSPAEKLDELAQQARDQMPPAMEEQARQAAEQMRLSDQAKAELERAMEQARAAAKQAAGAQSPEASEAMRRLAETLRQLARQGRQQMSGKELRHAQAQLQNIKFGQPTGEPRPGDGRGEPRTTFVDSSGRPGQDPGEDGQATVSLPGGRPGSERDEGTTESPFGEEKALPEAQGEGTQLTAVLGEGESLTDLVPAAGDTSKSTQRYRDLYKAIAGASEDAVDEENIPIASRFFVKRYFENIRPKE